MIFFFYLKSQKLLTLIVVLWLFNLETQGQVFRGQIISLPDSTPVPFASLTTQNHQWGQNVGEDGRFVLDQLKEGDTLLVSSLGYYPIQVPYHQLKDSVRLYLKVRPVQLAEVKIKGGRYQDIWLGAKQQSTTSGTGHPSYQNMQEIALWIPNFIQNEGYINKVGYWIMNSGKPKTPFRVRIYKNDHGMPGEDLLTQNLVVQAKRGGSWLDVDVSQYNIPFPEDGFFLAMEWLLVPDKKYYFKVRWSNGKVTNEFGQGAGTTREFAAGYGKIRNNGGKWEEFKYRNNPRPMFRAQVRVYE